MSRRYPGRDPHLQVVGDLSRAEINKSKWCCYVLNIFSNLPEDG